jgi:hypothetical protein
MLAAPTPDVRAIYEEAIERLLNGDMKDRKNSRGWNYVEELARQMLLDPKKAVELVTKASARGCLPAIKASVERAAALNAPKLALLATAERCKKRGGYTREDGSPAFYLDLPYKLHQLDPERHGPHVYLPTNRHHRPLGQEQHEGGSHKDHAGQAWHFRGDPHEIEGAWSKHCGDYLYVSEDRDKCKTERAFLELYGGRLRRILAEAVPSVGGLRVEPDDWD